MRKRVVRPLIDTIRVTIQWAFLIPFILLVAGFFIGWYIMAGFWYSLYYWAYYGEWLSPMEAMERSPVL